MPFTHLREGAEIKLRGKRMQIEKQINGSYKVITLKGNVIHVPATLRGLDTSDLIDDLARAVDDQCRPSFHVIKIVEDGQCVITHEGISELASIDRFLGDGSCHHK